MSIAPRLSLGNSAAVGPRTLSTMSAPKASSALARRAPAASNSASGKLALIPAPVSTMIECLPLAASFLTVSGVAATRVSPARLSRGMPMIMVSAPIPPTRRVAGYLATKALPDRGGDRAAKLCCCRLSAQVRRAWAIGQHALDATHHRSGGVGVAEVLEHQRAAPDLTNRIGNPF